MQQQLTCITLLLICSFTLCYIGKLSNVDFPGTVVKDKLECQDTIIAESLCYRYCQTNIIVSFNKEKGTCQVKDISNSGPAQVNFDFITYLNFEKGYY